MDFDIDIQKYTKAIEGTYYRMKGKVVNVIGLTIESAGPTAKIGDICLIYPLENDGEPTMAEVVGFHDKKTQLMPYDEVKGIGIGSIVENKGSKLIKVKPCLYQCWIGY